MLRAGQVVKAQVLAIDPEKRQIKLSMKQLIPTSIDEYIAEHKAGRHRLRPRRRATRHPAQPVELGEGIRAACRAGESAPAAALQTQSPQRKADLSSLSSMLRPAGKAMRPRHQPSPSRSAAGQIRSFKIVKLDAETKKIEVELAS